MQKSTQQSAGAASQYLLEDADAVDAFRATIGDYHRVAPGAVRTYLPEVDPAWEQDGSRHRFITMARMSDCRDRAWLGLAGTVQRISTEAPPPEALRVLSFQDTGQRQREERRAALVATRPAELAAMQREVTELRELLAMAVEDLEEADRSAELSARTVASLEEQLHAAGEREASNLEEALRALDDVERVRAEADVLRRRLRQAGRPGDTVIVEQPPGVPDSFEELWERLTEFPRIQFTADKATALELDEADRARVWAAKAWRGLRALDSYAHAQADGQGVNGGFYQFCTSGKARSEAVGWPHKQLAMTESESTTNRWGAERIFPVPEEVDASKRGEMQAHLKLDGKGNTSPRIHFLDNTRGATGRVIVGYIGPHLTNTKTN